MRSILRHRDCLELLKTLTLEEIDIIRKIALHERPTREWLLGKSIWGKSKTDAIVKDLFGKNILGLQDLRGPGKGRASHIYSIRKELGHVLGIELNPSGDRTVLKDLNGRLIAKATKAASIDQSDVLASMDSNISVFLDDCGMKWNDIKAIGIGVHGLSNEETGIVRRFLYHDEEVSVSFKEYFFQKHGVPVFISRPKYLVCLDEYLNTYIAGRKTFVNVNIGFGVGLSLFINGDYFHGFSGLAGEFGHLIVKENGKPCYCGNRGCLRTIASYRGICMEALSMLNEFEQEGVSHNIDKKALEKQNYEIGVEHLIDEALLQNKLSINLFYELGKTVGTALAMVVSLINPEILVIHTNLVRAGDFFTAPLAIALRRNSLSFALRDLKLEFAELKSYSVAEGGAVLAVMRFLQSLQTG